MNEIMRAQIMIRYRMLQKKIRFNRNVARTMKKAQTINMITSQMIQQKRMILRETKIRVQTIVISMRLKMTLKMIKK